MAARHSRSQPDEKHCNKQYGMDRIDHEKKATPKQKKKKQQISSWIIHKCISHDETCDRTRVGCALLYMQNKGNETTRSREKLPLVTFTLVGRDSWLIWDVFNFEIFFALRAAACLINFDSYIRHWHIICSVKSFSRRAPAFSLCEVDHLKGLLNYTTPAHW